MEDQKNYSNLELNILPVILSGGSGTRLWPLSRECFPKQYLNLEEKSKNSLLQNTFLRLKGLKNIENPLIICNEEQRFIVAEQMRELGVTPNSIVLEPVRRNTAPAITLAALITLQNYGDRILLILSSDHLINDSEKLKSAINEGIIHAANGRLVTFGIVPNSPETGYGYIEAFNKLTNQNKYSKIKKFIEKPNKEIAEKLITDKRYSWNSGIFMFKASSILKELKKFEPKIVDLCKDALEENIKDFNFHRVKKRLFEKCPTIPIDIAVMEKTKLGTVISLDTGWSDIGSWKSVWENSAKDSDGNVARGKILMRDAKDCYLRSEQRLVVGLGVKNLIIVETNDAILIADKECSESVKNIVKELEESSFNEGKLNSKMYRPWGNYTSILEDLTWKVKRLEIKPKASLSLQMHRHRAEHWIVVNGTARVEIDGKISLLEKNQSIYVPQGSKHRLSNPYETLLIIIEVQSGSYLGEDDILRFEDIYGRIDIKKKG